MQGSRSLKKGFFGRLLAVVLCCVSAGVFAATTVTMSGSPAFSCPPYVDYTLSVTCSISGKTITCNRAFTSGTCNFYGSGTGSSTSQILTGSQTFSSVAFSYPTWAGGLHVCATATVGLSTVRECFVPAPQADPLIVTYIGQDVDSDYKSDATDNCPTIANQNQLDTDADGIGDVCDPTPNGSPQTITVTTAAPANAAINSTFPVAATASSGLTVVITTSGDCTIAAGVVTITSAATACTVKYNQPGNVSWIAAPELTSVTAVDNPGIAQIITVSTPAPLTALMSSSFPIAANASSGLPVAITLSGGCTLASGVVTLFGTAACNVSYRQAGDATYAAAPLITSITTPVLINPTQVSAGNNHTCALDSAGVHCWGSNSNGQITVPALVSPVQVTAGGTHTCALDSTGVHCWGYNGLGQTTVPALTNPVQVSSGTNHTCALDSTGVHCWGYNAYGQSTVPALVSPTQVSAGGTHTCALDSTGVHCWGRNNVGQTNVPTLVNPVQISAGYGHACALDSTGVHCWGYNSNGQTTVPALTNPVQISAGGYHTCARDDTGVKCWGAGTTNTSLPDKGQSIVPALSSPTQVSAGQYHTCALDNSGVHCWGDNAYGQVANVAAQFFADADHDNVADATDNCVLMANTSQQNMDADVLGDVCDGDIDGDDIANGIDADPLSAATVTEIILPLNGILAGSRLGLNLHRQ